MEDATLLTRYSRTLWVSREITLLEGNAALQMGSFRSTEACEQAPELFNRERREQNTGEQVLWESEQIQLYSNLISETTSNYPMQVGVSQCLWPCTYHHSLKAVPCLHWEPESPNLPYPQCWE